ncbi:MAG: hypothetical protein ACR2QH_15115 [Geminicoccaceae bacterium]
MALPSLLTSAGFQSAANGSTFNNTFNSLTTGSDRVLVVAVFGDTSSTITTTGVTYNSVALTEIVQVDGEYPNPWIPGVSWWYLVAPATGSNSLNVTYDSSADSRQVWASVWTGGHQTTPVDVSNSDATTVAVNPGVEHTISLTTTVADCMLFGAFSEGDGGAWSPTSPATERYDNKVEFIASQVITQSAATATSHDLSSTSGRSQGIDEGERICIAAFALAPVAAAGISVGQAAETDTALPVTSTDIIAVGQANETDTAQSVAITDIIVVGQAVETDSAQPVTSTDIVSVGQASETDTALALVIGDRILVGQAVETDTAQGVTTRDIIAVGQAIEIDSAQPIILPIIPFAADQGGAGRGRLAADRLQRLRNDIERRRREEEEIMIVLALDELLDD